MPSEIVTLPVGEAPWPLTVTLYVMIPVMALLGPLTATFGEATLTFSVVVPFAVV